MADDEKDDTNILSGLWRRIKARRQPDTAAISDEFLAQPEQPIAGVDIAAAPDTAEPEVAPNPAPVTAPEAAAAAQPAQSSPALDTQAELAERDRVQAAEAAHLAASAHPTVQLSILQAADNAEMLRQNAAQPLAPPPQAAPVNSLPADPAYPASYAAAYASAAQHSQPTSQPPTSEIPVVQPNTRPAAEQGNTANGFDWAGHARDVAFDVTARVAPPAQPIVQQAAATPTTPTSSSAAAPATELPSQMPPSSARFAPLHASAALDPVAHQAAIDNATANFKQWQTSHAAAVRVSDRVTDFPASGVLDPDTVGALQDTRTALLSGLDHAQAALRCLRDPSPANREAFGRYDQTEYSYADRDQLVGQGNHSPLLTIPVSRLGDAVTERITAYWQEHAPEIMTGLPGILADLDTQMSPGHDPVAVAPDTNSGMAASHNPEPIPDAAPLQVPVNQNGAHSTPPFPIDDRSTFAHLTDTRTDSILEDLADAQSNDNRPNRGPGGDGPPPSSQPSDHHDVALDPDMIEATGRPGTNPEYSLSPALIDAAAYAGAVDQDATLSLAMIEANIRAGEAEQAAEAALYFEDRATLSPSLIAEHTDVSDLRELRASLAAADRDAADLLPEATEARANRARNGGADPGRAGESMGR